LLTELLLFGALLEPSAQRGCKYVHHDDGCRQQNDQYGETVRNGQGGKENTERCDEQKQLAQAEAKQGQIVVASCRDRALIRCNSERSFTGAGVEIDGCHGARIIGTFFRSGK
jgi:hypothetical protein